MAVELATAYVSLIPTLKGGSAAIEKELSGIGGTAGKKMSDNMADEVTKSTGKSGRLGKALGGIGGIISGGFLAGIAGSAAADLIGGFLSEAGDAEKVARQTAAVIKSTGGAAGVTAKQIDDLATALSLKAGVDDEVIASGENVLLTFTKVKNEAGAGNDIFNQGAAAALDMSAAMGSDLQGSILQVGKALNDPIKGVTALGRAGVQFTQQQKDQIKTMVESGDVLGAQKIILGELSTQFGGAAEAGATSSDKLKVAWGNAQEQIGTMLLPTFVKIADWLTKELPVAIEAFQVWWADFGDDIGRVLAETFKFIVEMVKGATDMVTAIIETSVAIWDKSWMVISSIVDFTRFEIIDPIVFSIQTMVDVIRNIIETGVQVWNTSWAVVSTIVDFTRTYVVDPITAIIQTMINVVDRTISIGVATITTSWKVLEAIVSWTKTYVINPIVAAVSGLATVVTTIFGVAVQGVRLAWGGIASVVSFFIDNVYAPLSTAVSGITNGIVQSFGLAVQAVQLVWNGLKEVVKAPINVVIGFYNKGIAGLWNFVASKVGLPELGTVAMLNSGGKVPGSGNTDTQPAMLTPGEWVINKKSVQAFGPELMAFLNDPDNAKGKTVDPGIFGYAKGGEVKYRDPDDVLSFARQQVGKPYSYSAGGSGNADCSYLWSVILNYALGAGNPYTRRFSTGTVQGDRALAPGLPPSLAEGLALGVRPPYQVNKAGQFVGHMAGTLMGVNFESTPPATRMSPSARGAMSGFPDHYYLPGFGGLSASDQAIADGVAGLKGSTVNAGGSMFGQMISALINKLPGAIFDFLMKKLPGMIVDAVKDALGGIFDFINPFANGGTVRRAGPILVGEHRPELLWANRDQYVQASIGAGGIGGQGGALLHIEGNIYGDTAVRDLIREEAAQIDFRRRATLSTAAVA